MKILIADASPGNRQVLKKMLSDMGFKNVAHVEGGFDSLKKSGLKVIKKEKK